MIGTVLAGKYRVVSLIGSGGMANVYKAVQIAGSHRTVAVKVLKEEFEGDGEFLRRFQQEAMAVVSLSHENIVRSYDVGEENGHHYIVLEYVEGKTLKERIRENGPMPARNAIQIAQQVLDALSHAHESGFIHRDVKPQNVIVTQRGRAKLADFGIVRDATASTVTFAGANVLGSVHYFSPEQAKGRPVTVESDIYSMGIMLYEMVTGQVPFTGETPVTVALKHLQETFTPPSQVNPNVPRALNDIILRATNKDPSERYHSARGMRQDLLRALREPDGDFARQNQLRTARQGKPPKRNMGSILRIGLSLGIVLALCVALFLVGNTLLQREKAETGDLVPTFIDKPLEEAKIQAERRAYVIEVVDTVQTEEKEPGVVISQDPAPGTALKAGNTVKVVVSEGVVMPVVPNLSGSTLAKAEETLQELGLKTGEVEYRISEAPIGTVYQQDPVPGTQVLEGDTVRLFISGEPSETIEVPNVERQSLPEALQLFQTRGFSRFRVRWGEPMDAVPEGQVYLQSPAPGESVLETALVELTACNTLAPDYSASIAFEMDVERDGTVVTVVVLEEADGIPYERVVLEQTLDAGEGQMLSFTAYASVSGEHTLIRYVDGEEIRRVNTNFSYAG